MIKSEDDKTLAKSIQPFEKYMFALTPAYQSRHMALDCMEIGIIPDGRLRLVSSIGMNMREHYMLELNRAFQSKGIYHDDILRIGCFASYFGVSDGERDADALSDYQIWKKLLQTWARENHRVVGFALHASELDEDGVTVKPMHAHVLYEREKDVFDEPQEYIWRSLL